MRTRAFEQRTRGAARALVIALTLSAVTFLPVPSLERGLRGASAPGEARAFPWPSRTRELLKALQRGTPEEKRAALESLPELSPAMSRPVLAWAFEDGDREVRLAAARHALRVRWDHGNDSVVPWLRESDPELVLAALELLALRAPESALEGLARALSVRSSDVRVAALRALSGVPRTRAADAARAIVPVLDDPEARVRGEAVEALGRLGAREAAGALSLRLDDWDAAVRRRAAVALGVLAEGASEPALLAAVEDRDVGVAEAALVALGWFDGAASAQVLVRALQGSPWSRKNDAALEALTRRGGPEIIEGMTRALGRLEGRERLLDALAARGDALGSAPRDCWERAGGQELVGCARLWLRLGEPSAPLIGLVRGARLSEETLLELWAREGALDDDAVVFALERTTSSEPALRQAARAALRRVERWKPALREPLRAALGARGLGPSERAELLELCVGDHSPALLELARAALSSSDVRTARASARVLVRATPEAEGIRQALGEPRWAESVAAELARGGLDDEAAVVLLRDYSERGSKERAARRAALRGVNRRSGSAVIEGLARLVEGSRGDEAEELLGLLARLDGADAQLLELQAGRSRAQRLGLASWAGYRSSPALALAFAKDRDEDVRALGLLALGRLGLSVEGFETRTRRERWAAFAAVVRARAAGRAPPGDFDERARRSLDDDDATARALAVAWLGRSGGAEVERELEERLRRDEHPFVRAQAARHLRSLGAAGAALRACAAYEVDESVARECTALRPTPRAQGSADERAEPRLESLLERDGSTRPAARAVALEGALGLDFAIASPGGRLLVPPDAFGLVEPGLAF